MSDWQKGIGRLDPKAKINFSFYNGFSAYCDNLQLFKALGIYDQVEQDVLRGYESAQLKYWGIPNASEDHGYYNRSERPLVTVMSTVKIDSGDMGKTIVLKNDGREPITHKIKIKTSRTEFEETVIDVSTSMEFNQSTEIGVVSQSSGFTATFSAKSGKEITKSYSQETEVSFLISTGEQLVKIKNPTKITQFKVRVDGKFCLNCSPKYKNHYLWMPHLNEVYDCQVVAKDIGATSWQVEKVSDNA